MNQNLKKAAGRIAGMLGIGRITSQKDSGEIQQAQYQTPLEVASAPRMSDFGFSSGLPVGTDVVIAFIGGDRSSPVIIASNHQGYRRTGLNEGETVFYNKWALEVLLTEKGVFIDAKGKDVEVNNATNVTINASEGILANTPVLKCTGDIIDNCESNTRTLKELRDAHNDHDHVVKNVQKGNDDATSEKTEEQVK
ncbi:phage baseplate assembly protein [Salmonella enterica]|nr:phage baseplate assembly protein [Salmonella enterica]EHJ8506444.1 phage baseplate assembly protein [Salmonella enterica subsp. diarizonae serovar 47:k:z53:[z84]]ELJ2688564.1 phage baseplate assembly protein [Salmonella enterica subsp. diarizonae]QJY72322.1 baseplate assembly protein [Salmonella enterica subsp. diarizonae serovar 47:k:z35]WGI48085.1 phage baseplate assembly protein [Salmonella enterica subsp. diarizonae serovar 48:i:z]EHL5943630.1 phage baseplate assembly protein [Salmonell